MTLLLILACGDKDPAGDSGSIEPADSAPLTDSGDSDPGVDADGDGFTEDVDCDDADPEIHPDADEVCDGVDNDCDGQIDVGAVDMESAYEDQDHDGYGGKEFKACDVSNGVDNDDDCDDSDPDVNPGAEEICDGVDNDCDGVVESNIVPDDYATLQEAVEAVEDGGMICVAGGTYSEQLDLTGRTLTLAAHDATWEMTASHPMVLVDNYDEETEQVGDAWSDLTFTGWTISGGDWTADTSEASVLGGFLRLGGGDARFEDVVVTDMTTTMVNGGDLQGMVARSRGGGNISVDGATLSDIELRFELGASDGTHTVHGGVFDVEGGGELALTDVTMTDTTVVSVDDPASCYTNGVLGRVYDGTVALSGITVDGLDYTTTCTSSNYLHGAVFAMDYVDGTIEDVTLTGIHAHQTSSSSAYSYGAIEWDDGTATWTDIDASDNTFTTTNDSSSSYVYGVLDLDGTHTFSGVTAWNNVVRAEATGTSTSGYARGTLNLDGQVDLQYVDVRNNTLYGARYAYGGAMDLSPDEESSVTMKNFILAGNTCEAGSESAYGGALSVGLYDGPVTAVNGDIVGNQVIGGAGAYGGGVYAAAGDPDSELDLVNVNVVSNSVSGATAEGAAGYATDNGFATWNHSNLYDNTGADAVSGDVVAPLELDPAYTSVSGDAVDWDLSLSEGSEAIDAGDPTIADDDSTVSDLGAYGGPGGSAW